MVKVFLETAKTLDPCKFVGRLWSVYRIIPSVFHRNGVDICLKRDAPNVEASLYNGLLQYDFTDVFHRNIGQLKPMISIF